MGFIAGLRVKEFTAEKCSIAVPYRWLNQNPFSSTYFAVLAMAAEMSTGMLAFGQIFERNPSVSMLVVGMEAQFYKKAVDKITFTCSEGNLIANAIEETLRSGEGQTIKCSSIGKNEAGEKVSEFWFTWSFKAKINKQKLKKLIENYEFKKSNI